MNRFRMYWDQNGSTSPQLPMFIDADRYAFEEPREGAGNSVLRFYTGDNVIMTFTIFPDAILLEPAHLSQ